MSHVLLSIIMPCYNVEETISRALDSVFMQRTDFDYEVIAVDDASTDGSLARLQAYRREHPRLRILCHEQNQGNARAFYDGLSAAAGDFFCVLDGDDYYTIPDKLQRQIDFFRTDVHEEYVASAHYHILDLGEGRVNLPPTSAITEFTYADFLTQNAGYYHTATYMYRNIFRGNVPAFFRETLYRGDTPRTTFHLMYSHKKVRVLHFVGSAYTFQYGGLWSSMQVKKQFEYQVNYLTKHRERLASDFERASADNLIQSNKRGLRSSGTGLRQYETVSIDGALVGLRRYAGEYAFRHSDFMFGGLFYSEYVDSACATLGYVHSLLHREELQGEAEPGHIAIVVGVLNPKGGGIFRELTELIEMYAHKQVYLFVTNSKEIPRESTEALRRYGHLHVVPLPPADTDALGYFSTEMNACAPCKAYIYASHNDVYAQALPLPRGCRRICLFSFDHGYLCGISNPNYDCYIAKRPGDYALLSKRFGDRVIYVPTWNRDVGDRDDVPAYRPFDGHERLVTACAAARFYKVDGKPPYEYIDLVAAALAKTKGKHYHFGELSPETLARFRARLAEEGVPEESFVHIPWVEELGGELLKKRVDLFIEPFPVVSYKISLEVMSCGIPVIAFDGPRRMERADFLYPGAFLWRDREGFGDTLAGVTAEELAEHSRRARAYFLSDHEMTRLAPFFLEERPFARPAAPPCADEGLTEIRSFGRLFADRGRIQIMDRMPAARSRRGLKSALKRWDSWLRERRRSGISGKLLLLLSPYSVYLLLTRGRR